jgi:hypothetical protein
MGAKQDYKYRIVERIAARTNLTKKDVKKVYQQYFIQLRRIFNKGIYPAAIMTSLISFQFSAPAIRRKCKSLTEVILSNDLPALKKRFDCETKDEARALLTELIRIYKMKKQYDNQNTLSKRRNYNGWDFSKREELEKETKEGTRQEGE